MLVNRKLAMRAGETDVAETVDDAALARAGREPSARRCGHVGALDVDVFVDEGLVSVLDVNPRFGGNYPFAHLAGADVPRAYVGGRSGEDVSDDAFAVRAGTVGLKAIGRSSCPAERAGADEGLTTRFHPSAPLTHQFTRRRDSERAASRHGGGGPAGDQPAPRTPASRSPRPAWGAPRAVLGWPERRGWPR